ncbi:uncharacterized protein BDV14DRAFT_194790 [Aspergillus stella-maris]|uniref:uncharacterized protein n=1 Tax=Aspergillus stella-maris TaxID=1810926 RepID=UPI003CCE2F1E
MELMEKDTALPEAHTWSLTLLDLPIELLRNILDNFSDPPVEQGRVRWRKATIWSRDIHRENQKIIQIVRLVCQKFNEVASPLLCPVLQVDLDQASLERAVNLSYSPRVALGIRAIRVGMQCFPGGLARDPERFMELRLSKVRQAVYDIEYACDEPPANEQGVEDDSEAEQQGRPYSAALDRGHKIWASWDDLINRLTTDPGPVQPSDEYQEILCTGFEKFCLKHQQQREMLASQFFVRTLASCMVRMPNALSLGFSDETKEHPPEYPYDPDFLVENEVLSRMITAPMTWQELEYTDDMHHATARILSDLPIAIHQAGISLSDMYVGIFPCIRNQTLVFSRPHDPTLWDDLRAAYQSLRRADFGDSLNCLPIRHSHLAPEDSLHLNEYLSALLSSPSLERITINTTAFGVDDGRGRQSGYDLSRVLSAANWPCIRNLKILSVSITQSALKALFSGLGCSVEYLQLSSFELLDGRWVGVLDILREKIRPRATIYFTPSWGGEFGVRVGRPRKSWDHRNYSIPETPPIFGEVVRYISGVEMENPLRDWES